MFIGKKLVIGLVLAVMSVGQVFANSYKARLVAAVSNGQSGMGTVYAGQEPEVGDTVVFRADSVESVKSTNAKGEMCTFYAFAKSNDESRYAFMGWSETDGGMIVSKDNPYKVNIPTSDTSSGFNTVNVYANFLEKKSSTLSFVSPVNGTFTATDNVNHVAGEGSMTTRELVYLTATPAEGYKVKGWYREDANGKKTYFTYEKDAEMMFGEDCKVGVEFVKEDVPVFMLKDGDMLYTDLSEATADAKEGDVIVVVSDGVLPKGDYTIAKGVTLLIPFDSKFTCFTAEDKPHVDDVYRTPSVYKTLTLADGATITVDGMVSVSAEMFAITNTMKLPGGAPHGDYGHLHMQKGSKMVLNEGATLCAWSFVTGEGNIIANDGSFVYEGFQMTEFRGGTMLNDMAENEYRVFPFNQYYIQNVEVPMTLCKGAEEMVVTAFHADGKTLATDPFTFVGEDGLFVLGDGAKVTKSYDPKRDRQVYELDGDAKLGSLDFTMSGVMIGSEDFVLPLTNNLTIKLVSGTLTIDNMNGVALLPDAEMTVGKDATLLIKDSHFYVYDGEVWGKYSGFYSFVPTYSPTCTYERTSLGDATLDIQGTVVTEKGNLYTTKGGANVICSEGRGKLVLDDGLPDDATFQAEVQKIYEDGRYVETVLAYIPIDVTPVRLKNSATFAGTEKEYVQTANSPAGTVYYYHQETGEWDNDEIPTMVDGVDEESGEHAVYNISGLKMASLRAGMNIVKKADGSVRKVFVK